MKHTKLFALTAALACSGAFGADTARESDLQSQLKVLQERMQALEQRERLPERDEPEGGGLTAEGSVIAVGQRANARGADDGRRQGRLSYRSDVLLTLPGPSVGAAKGGLVAQLRFGQGSGVALRPTYTGTVNSTAFDPAAGADESYAIVAQAYYELVWPLDAGRFNDRAGNRIELTLGKLDIFGLFDQNAVAGDEGSQFLNNIFVHNPLLDSGGDIAADRYGFAPGARLAYFAEGDAGTAGFSVGVFGAGSGASFAGSPGRPLVVAQLEASPRQVNGEALGNYRVYLWTNGRTEGLDGSAQRHTGVGVSVDQRVGRDLNLFARLGRRFRGHGSFDHAVTIGLANGGRAWGRGGDTVGIAVGRLATSSAWRAATADGTLTGAAATGAERSVELYYRARLSEKLEISPNMQWIQRPSGDAGASTVRVVSLRARLGF